MKTRILLISILIIAAFFRFYKLDVLPPGLHPDEAANGLDIIRMMDNNDFRVFYNTNGPREALFFYLQGIFVWLLGFTQLALRLAPALLGVLTILGLYLFVKEFFQFRNSNLEIRNSHSEKIALLSSFLLAVSSWHIQFSRNGFRAIMVPLILVLLFYFLTKAIREKRRVYFILTGIFFALGFYTYLSYLMILPIAFFFIMYLLILRRNDFKNFIQQNWQNIIFGLLAAIIVYLPLGVHFIKYPGDFLARPAGTSILNPEFGNPLQLFIENFQKSLLMFNWAGDENYRHNYAGWPMLDPIVGIFFVVGSILTLSRLNQTAYFFLFLWFGFMLAPTILSAESIPHSLRAVGTIPLVYIFAALGIQSFYNYLTQKIGAKNFANILLVILLIFSPTYSYIKYFVLWAEDPATYRAYDSDTAAAAKFLNNLPSDVKKYALILGYSSKSLEFLTHPKNYSVGDQAKDLEKIKLLPSDKYVVTIQEVLFNEARPILNKQFSDGKFKIDNGFFYYTNAE